MLNYAVDPAALAPHVPAGTELDVWNGTHYVSVVGFMFLKTRVLGIPIPFHMNFPEVNLRFYVRRRGEVGEPTSAPTAGAASSSSRRSCPEAAIAPGRPHAVRQRGLRRAREGCPPSIVLRAQRLSGRVAYAWRLGKRWN